MSQLERIDPRNWNRRFLLSFLYVHLLALVAGELYVWATDQMTLQGQLHYVVNPILTNVGILGLMELLFRWYWKGFAYVTIFFTTVMCSVFVRLHPEMDYIQSLLLFPVMMSAMYHRRGVVLYSGILTVAAFFLLTWRVPGLRERTDPGEWVIMPMILLMATVLSWSAMMRGLELLRELGEETKDKQDLMIQNVIKDRMVRTDPLTGLYNRKALNEHLDALLQYGESGPLPLYTAMLDIDRFKSVNDTFGHPVGDVILKRIAKILQDRMDPMDFAARYGGEEFTLVFVDRNRSAVFETLERIRRDAEAMSHKELDGRSVTVSIGLAAYRPGMTREHLLEQADDGLYQAKRNGRNRVMALEK